MKENMTLSQLIGTMRSTVANLGMFAKGDTLTDVQTIAAKIEEMEEAHNFITTRFYWGVRENGTELTPYCSDIIDWVKSWSSEVQGTYLIQFSSETKRFSLQKTEIKG